MNVPVVFNNDPIRFLVNPDPCNIDCNNKKELDDNTITLESYLRCISCKWYNKTDNSKVKLT